MGTYKVKKMLTYVDEAIGFSVSYPDNWAKMSESPDYLVGFVEPEAGQDFQANYLVSHEEVPATKDLHEYFDTVKRGLQRKFREYTSVSEEEITIDGMLAKKHICTHSEKKTTFKQMLICLKQGKVGWLVVFTSTVDGFETYQPTFEAIMASIHLFKFNRGNNAKFIYPKAVIKSDIRGWGIGFIIIGIIHIVVPVLDPVWGGLLIVLGVLELFIQRRGMYILNGLIIIGAGIGNLVTAIAAGGGGWAGFAGLQFLWGVNEFRKFFKYQTRAPAGLATVAGDVSTSVQPRGVGIESTQAGVVSAESIQPKVTTVESGKPQVAGILSIVSGSIGLLFWGIGFIATVATAPLNIGLCLAYAIALIVAVVAILGGVYSIKRVRWGLVLASAICAVFIFLPLGLPAVILVASSKRHFA